MNPDSVRTKEFRFGDQFRISTDFECGHGIVTLAEDGVTEIEMIALSKAARYVCMEVRAERDCQVQLRVVPDRQYKVDLASFHTWIWGMYNDSGEWLPLEKGQMRIHLSHIDLNIQLKAGQKITLSSEMALPYSQTRKWLRTLDGRQDFTLVEIGCSIDRNPIYCLQRLGSERKKPVILVLAGEHGTEFAGEFVARGMLAAVLEDSEAGRTLREEYDWGFVLNCNPDGNINGWHQYNRSDWAKHAYPFPEDISWHHEYGPFLSNPGAKVSPETTATGTWVLHNQPAFIFNMHSWQGNDGNLGAYRASSSMEKHPFLMETLDSIAEKIANGFKVRYLRKDSGNLASGHLGDTLSALAGIPSFSPEAHLIVGSEHLRQFGYEWLHQGLRNPDVCNKLKEIASGIDERYQQLDTSLGLTYVH